MKTTWDFMDEMAQECRDYLDGLRTGRIRNGDERVLRKFQQSIAPRLGPVSLLVLIEAWQEKNPRPTPPASPTSRP